MTIAAIMFELYDTQSDSYLELAIVMEFITKTCPCNMQRFMSEAKIENFTGTIWIFFKILLKTLIVGTH